MNRTSFDVVVVGGGMSGLVAARRLVSLGVESIVVLEARDEPGGRCHLRPAAGHRVDCGGMFVRTTEHHVRELASAYGIGTYRIQVEGAKSVRLVNGAPHYSEPGLAQQSPAVQAEVDDALAELDRICASVPAERPWDADAAEQLDLVTAETWIRGQSHDPDVQAALRRFVQDVTTGSTRQISLLSLAAFIQSTGGMSGFRGEIEIGLFDGGAGQIPERMASELGIESDWAGLSRRCRGPGPASR